MEQPCFISASLKPRERLLRNGPDCLSDAELIAVILGSGIKGCSAIQLSAQMLDQFGGLRRLLAASLADLRGVKGLGNAKICQIAAINELAGRSLSEELKTGNAMDCSETVKRFCAQRLGHLTVEHCIALYLDSCYRLICSEVVSRGTLTETSVYPREVVKAALSHHAAAVIVAHNHPSGLLEASPADIRLTRMLRDALKLVDIKLLDHIIVGAGKGISMAEERQM